MSIAPEKLIIHKYFCLFSATIQIFLTVPKYENVVYHTTILSEEIEAIYSLPYKILTTNGERIVSIKLIINEHYIIIVYKFFSLFSKHSFDFTLPSKIEGLTESIIAANTKPIILADVTAAE